MPVICRGVKMERHISDINILSFRGIKNLELKNVKMSSDITYYEGFYDLFNINDDGSLKDRIF